MMQRKAIIAECREKHGRTEISDECAKGIVQCMIGGQSRAVSDAAMAFLFHDKLPADDYEANGDVKLTGETKLWRLLFARYTYMSADERIMGDMLGTWLIAHSQARLP